MPLSDITLEELRQSTKAQILNRLQQILTEMTKKRLCEWIWMIKDLHVQDVVLEISAGGADSTWGQVLRNYILEDILGEKIGSLEISWTYYDTGEVDVIDIDVLDALDHLINRVRIKHFKSGSDPIIITGV